MTTTTYKQDKKISKEEVKKAIKETLPFYVQKIGENIIEAVLTLTVAGLTIAYIGTAINPHLAETFAGYIITGFVLILLRRVIQDFDDSMTVDELSNRLIATEKRIEEIYQYMSAGDNENFDERLRDDQPDPLQA